jgi:hypothetical protein
MLKIKTVNSYVVPKYPKGAYKIYPDSFPLSTTKGVLAAAVMVLMLDACSDNDTRVTGGIPAPELVTESEARTIIDSVFTLNGINLTHDVDVKFETTPDDTATVNVDGFNDSLQVGYEYMSEPDYTSFTSQVRTSLDSLVNETGGPYVKSIDATPIELIDILEAMTQEFIDTLKANGAI